LILRELFEEIGKPCAFGLPFGHEGENRTLPLGVRARLSCRSDLATLDVVEPAVR